MSLSFPLSLFLSLFLFLSPPLSFSIFLSFSLCLWVPSSTDAVKIYVWVFITCAWLNAALATVGEGRWGALQQPQNSSNSAIREGVL